jgi:hypothetical protein
MTYAVFSLAATNMAAVVALVLSLRSASLERRILFSASLEANGKTDAARRASAPTQGEAQASVDQQIKLMAEAKENGGVFSGNPYASPPKPVGI